MDKVSQRVLVSDCPTISSELQSRIPLSVDRNTLNAVLMYTDKVDLKFSS